MNLKTFLTLGLASVLAISLGCSSDDCISICEEQKLECNCCPQIANPDMAKVSLKGVHVFLETSGSMSGYMPTGANTTIFQQVIPDFLDRLANGNGFRTHFYSINESSQRPHQENIVQASQKILKGSYYPWGQYTSIPVMLDTIHHYSTADDVAILISDMIYSPEEEKEVNQAITKIRQQVSKNKTAASLIALTSSFYSKHPSKAAPYYLLLQGKPANIEAVKAKIKASLSVYKQDYQEVNFNYQYNIPYYSIIPFMDNTGNGEVESCGKESGPFLKIKEVNIDDSLSFWMGVNLQGLPSYSTTPTYLIKNVKLEGKGANVKLEDVVESANFKALLNDEIDKEIAGKCTHFLRLRLRDMESKLGIVTLQINNVKPNWLDQYSHSELTRANTYRDKTFGLGNVYTAIQDAYGETNDKPFIQNVQFILLKK